MNKLYFALIFVVSVYTLEPNIISVEIQVPNVDEKYQIVNTYLYPEKTSQSSPKISQDVQAQKKKNNKAQKQVKINNNSPRLTQKSKQQSNRQQKFHTSEREQGHQQSMRDQDIESQNKQIISISKNRNGPPRKESATVEYGKQIFQQIGEELNKNSEHKITISSFSQNNQNLQKSANIQNLKEHLTNSKIPFYKRKIIVIPLLIVVVLVSIYIFQRYQQKKRLSWSAVISHLDTYHTTVRVIRQEEQQNLNFQESKLEQSIGKDKVSQQK